MERFQITWGGACFGIETEEGRVCAAAPIAKWTKGKDWARVSYYYLSQGAKIKKIDNGEQEAQSLFPREKH